MLFGKEGSQPALFNRQFPQVAASNSLEDATIRARTVKRPARSPEWTVKTLRSAADVRHYTEDFKRQFARWTDSDDQ